MVGIAPLIINPCSVLLLPAGDLYVRTQILINDLLVWLGLHAGFCLILVVFPTVTICASVAPTTVHPFAVHTTDLPRAVRLGCIILHGHGHGHEVWALLLIAPFWVDLETIGGM